MWIKRTFEEVLTLPAEQLSLFPVWLLTGPRQVGKSSLLLRCAEQDENEGKRQYINLDELDVRARANEDPVLFSRSITLPVIIDEIQYAPALLSQIKVLIDKGVPPGAVWLSGSQSFEVMKGVQESLAGRVAVMNLYGLSDVERGTASPTPQEYFAKILESTFPKLHEVTKHSARELYLSSYVKTYIERDIRELLGIQKRREFEIFLKVCALRTGQVIQYDSIARDCGVSSVTVKEWLGVLEDSFLIKLVHPYHSNRTKRLIKSPKLYFLDMGLCAYLAGFHHAEQLFLGPYAGAALETHLFDMLIRFFANRAREAQIFFWRTRDKAEIDFLVEHEGKVYPIEVKKGSPDARELLSLEKIAENNWAEGTVLSLTQIGRERTPVAKDWYLHDPFDLNAIFA